MFGIETHGSLAPKKSKMPAECELNEVMFVTGFLPSSARFFWSPSQMLAAVLLVRLRSRRFIFDFNQEKYLKLSHYIFELSWFHKFCFKRKYMASIFEKNDNFFLKLLLQPKSNYMKTKFNKFFSFYELRGELHFLVYGI